MSGVSQRTFWNGEPEPLQDLFTATNTRGSHARCVLWSHPLGWELRLDVNGSLIRSQVVRSPEHISETAEDWKTGMQDRGWAAV